MEAISVNEFYSQIADFTNADPNGIIPMTVADQLGHFNVFSTEDLVSRIKCGDTRMPYNRRTYYKISLIRGNNIAEYADKVINIKGDVLLFATPKIPYHYYPVDLEQGGYFCIFTEDFLLPSKSGVILEDLPIFQPGGVPVFQLEKDNAEEIDQIFRKLMREINSDYLYKYDLIRSMVIELIHYGQKLQPLAGYRQSKNASSRIVSLFIELLERQFPVTAIDQRMRLRSAKDFADQLAIHSNHLNKVLKESTGKTTTELINKRLAQEATIMLKQTDWNVSEIAYTLGFEQLSHFSTFFKRETLRTPVQVRQQH